MGVSFIKWRLQSKSMSYLTPKIHTGDLNIRSTVCCSFFYVGINAYDLPSFKIERGMHIRVLPTETVKMIAVALGFRAHNSLRVLTALKMLCLACVNMFFILIFKPCVTHMRYTCVFRNYAPFRLQQSGEKVLQADVSLCRLYPLSSSCNNSYVDSTYVFT